MKQVILVASSSFDSDTHTPVCEQLARRGADVVLYETDRIMSGQQSFTIRLTGDHLTVRCDGRNVHPDQVAAAWLWKVASFRNRDAESNVSKQLSMVNELVLWNNTIWTLYPEDIWLNAPVRTAAADRKLIQLQVAHQVGFTTPLSIVSSEWGPIETALFADDVADPRAVVKMLRGVLADQNTLKAMYTEVLDRSRLDRLRSVAQPFPGLYQNFVDKAREWRVTVVGDACFPVAIYTDEVAKDDWRRHQLTPSVRYAREALPASIEASCRSFLARFGLRYGAFDLVERADGEIVFLECNPSGQHNWLEAAVGIPVAEAIASELLEIASRGNAPAQEA